MQAILTPPGEMPLYAVAGHPVAHSQSPFIHACFSRQTGVRMRYERLLCPLEGFAPTVREFARVAHGCNVTVPFKAEAFALAGTASDRARLAGAANTLKFVSPEPEDWLADNTDGAGLVRDIEINAGLSLAHQRVLLIGAGGAAAGALGPLVAARPREIQVINRTAAKAQFLVQCHADWARQHEVRLHAGGLGEEDRAFDLVINASASSLQGAEIPIGAGALREGSLVLDMMYGPSAARFLDWARSHGALARDGLGMLVEQAAEAWILWHGMRPQTAETLTLLRQRLASTEPKAD